MMGAREVRAGRSFVELYLKDKLAKGLARASKTLKNFGGGVNKIAKRVAVIGTVATGAIGAASAYFSKYGDSVAKMAKRTGLGVEAVSELDFVATQTGSNFATVENAFRKMQRSIYDAGRGLSTQVDALADVGLTFQDLDGLSPEQQFYRLADAISQVEDPSKRAAIAMSIFGRTGTNLLPMFAQGAEGIEKLRKRARELGLTVSGADAQLAEEYTDSIDRMSRASKAAAFQVGAALAPMLIEAADAVTRVVVTVRNWISDNRELVKQIAIIAVIVGGVGFALLALGTTITLVGVAVGAMASIMGVAASVAGILASAIAAMFSPLGIAIGLAAALAAAWIHYSGSVGKTISFLGQRFGDLFDDVKFVVGGIRDALAAGDIKLAAEILWKSLKLVWLEGKKALQTVWSEMWSGIRKFLAESLTGIRSAAEFAWNGLVNTWIEITTSLKKAWASFTGFMKKKFKDAQTKVAEGMLRIKGKFDKDFDVQAAIDILYNDADADKKKIDSERQAAINEAESDRKQRLANQQASHEESIAAIVANENEALSEINAESKTATDQTQSDIDSLKAQLVGLVKEANEAGEAARNNREAGDVPGMPDFNVEDFITDIDVATKAAAEKQSSRSTFNAAALLSLQATPQEKKTAENVQNIARNVERLTRPNKKNGLRFV